MAKPRSLIDQDRPRNYSFALTPLADAMFQLLVFFMLSSSLAPYSLLTLVPGPKGASDTTGKATAPAADAEPVEVAIWHLSRGELRAGRVTIPISDLSSLIPEMRARDITRVVLFTTRTATVQDIATTLEVLNVNDIPSVQLVTGTRG